MRLKRVEVKQFRSLRDVTLDVESHSPLVLLGVNETGKSNVLRALGLLNAEARVSPDDLRQARHDEPTPAEGSVRFVLEPTEAEYRALQPALQRAARGFAVDLTLRSGDSSLDLEAFVRRHWKTLPYTVDVPSGQRRLQVWGVRSEFHLDEGWCVPKQGMGAQKVNIPNVGVVLLESLPVLPRSVVGEAVPETLVVPATPADVVAFFSSVALEVLQRGLPTCVSWSHAQDAVLPGTIEFDAFVRNPKTVPAVHNMFLLADVQDVAEAVRNARTRANGVRTLLDRVGAVATRHLREVWTDKSVSLVLSENGPKLECVVRDANGGMFDFERRSDGFRRFASFMLSVAARGRAGGLDDALLVYDEPDASLHPAAARQLKSELLQLGARCRVVYSTHSTFMVDVDNVSRHLIVSKGNEETRLARAEPTSIRDEEVLYRAVGHSIFADLKPLNLLVEGFTDGRLIEVALEGARGTHASTVLDAVGRCHLRGVKNVPQVTAMLDLARRDYIIVTDSDRPAKERRREYEGLWRWFTYSELVSDDAVLTVEDFILVEHVVAAIRVVARAAEELTSLEVALSEAEPVLPQFDKALAAQRVEKERRKELARLVKEQIFAVLRPSHLRPAAGVLLERLAQVCTEGPRAFDRGNLAAGSVG